MTAFVGLIACLTVVALGLLSYELLLWWEDRHPYVERDEHDAEIEAERHARPVGNVFVFPRLQPTWPDVRCDNCGLVYRVPESNASLVIGDCPSCHQQRFSTVMESADEL